VNVLEGHYSVKQAAEAMKVSTKTIRNRIASGELPAAWEDRGVGMSQWWIPIEALQIAATTVEVIPITRQLTPNEVGQIVQNAVQAAIKQELKPVKEEISQLRGELENHFRRQDEKIRKAAKPKVFWKRFFNK
jgi:excisionase family DNA binding protein